MALTKIGASLGGAADTLLVTQTNHGFVDFDRGKAVRMLSTGLYALATADAIANADAVGIIIQRIDANTLLLALSGRVTVDGCVPTGTAGTVLFLPVTSTKNVENTGLLLATEPSTASQVSKPMAVITISGSEMILFQMRGEVITTGVIAVADNSVTSAKIVDGAIVNADVNASAAVAFSKMENLTASRLLVSDGSGDVSVSSVTTTNLTDLTDAGETALHTHAGGVSAASKEEMEGSDKNVGPTSTTVYASPGRTQNHPGVIKGRARVFTNGTNDQNYNVTSITRNSEGDYTVTWATDFSSVDHGWAITPASTNVGGTIHVVTENASTTQYRTYNSSQTLDDETCSILVWGDQ